MVHVDRRVGAREGDAVQHAVPGPETTGRHRRVEVPVQAAPALTDTGRHRAVTVPPASAGSEPVRRRHAADAAPATHPDARVPSRSRAPRRILAGTALVAVALAPVLARSTSALGMHDAVAADVAAHPDQAEETLEQLNRGGVLAGAVTPSPAPAGTTATTEPGAGENPDAPTAESAGDSGARPSSSRSGATDGTAPAAGAESPSPSTVTGSGPVGVPAPVGTPTTTDTPGTTEPEGSTTTPTGSTPTETTTGNVAGDDEVAIPVLPPEPTPSDQAPETSAPPTATETDQGLLGAVGDLLEDLLMPGAG